MKQPAVWLDLYKPGMWGIECDDPTYTFDGHFICVVPAKDEERSRLLAQMLHDALIGRHPLRRGKGAKP